MGYLHIPNLYKVSDRLMAFRELYALEKVHGTSAHIRWTGTEVKFYSGGANHEAFVALFDAEALAAKFTERFGTDPVTVYGEAYGGKLQRMAHTYGPELRFIVFDVQSENGRWWNLESAEGLATFLGLEFVPYMKVPANQQAVDFARDHPSFVAMRRGITEPRPAEGVVLRPPFELTTNNGDRVIAKHKRPEFCETASKREAKPDERTILAGADAVAREWVTAERLSHVLDKLAAQWQPPEQGPIGEFLPSVEDTGEVIVAMTEDVLREGAGEFEDTKAVRKAIGKEAARIFKRWLAEQPRSN